MAAGICLQAFRLFLRRRCKILVAPGFIPGIEIAQSKKVRPQKWQKVTTLHAPQNKELQNLYF